jgi:serine/threonine protein kinase
MGNLSSTNTAMSNINIDSIDASSVRNWDLVSDHLTDVRRDNHILFSEEQRYICSSLNDDSSEIQIKKRIGSQSGEGEVYLIEYSDHLAAMKLLPYIDYKSEERIRNEIKIALFLSDKVVRRETEHFPVVYSYAMKCSDIAHSPYVSSIIADTRKWAIVDKIHSILQNESSVKAKRFRANYLQGSFPTVYALEKFALDNHISLNNTSPSVAVMISELAWGDLRGYLDFKRPSIDLVQRIIDDIFEGIRFLHSNGIFHGDLHTGNVLIVLDKDGNYVQSLIHDFGRSSQGPIFADEIKMDYSTILETMLKNSSLDDQSRDYISNKLSSL